MRTHLVCKELIIEKILPISEEIEDLFVKLSLEFPNNLKKYNHKRKLQYYAGRVCSALALKDLGCQFINVLKDNNNRPIWPNGYIGSISHTEKYAYAKVLPKGLFNNIGVDIENLKQKKDFIEPLQNYVIVEEEYKVLHNNNFEKNLIIAFSVKESFFKCVNPLTNIFFDFSYIKIKKICFNKNIIELEIQKNIGRFFSKGLLITAQFKFMDNNVITSVLV